MKKRLICLAILQLTCNNAMSQETEIKPHVYLVGKNVTKVFKVEQEITIPDGGSAKSETKYKKGETSHTVTVVTKEKEKIKIEKEIAIPIGASEGNANLRVSSDSSYIEVNYWLSSEITIHKNESIKTIKRKIVGEKLEAFSINDDLSKYPTVKQTEAKKVRMAIAYMTPEYSKKWGYGLFNGDNQVKKGEKLISKNEAKGAVSKDDWKNTEKKAWEDQNEELKKAKTVIDETVLPWFEGCDEIIVIYDEQNNIACVLANKYDSNGDYRIKLENREFFKVPSKHWSLGLVTVPFKYHFGYGEAPKKASSDFSANLNVGPFLGYTWGRYRVRYETDHFVQLPELAFTFGGFVNIGAVTVNAANSTAASYPLTGDNTKTIGALSPGIGTMLTINNVNIGVFAGYDAGIWIRSTNLEF